MDASSFVMIVIIFSLTLAFFYIFGKSLGRYWWMVGLVLAGCLVGGVDLLSQGLDSSACENAYEGSTCELGSGVGLFLGFLIIFSTLFMGFLVLIISYFVSRKNENKDKLKF